MISMIEAMWKARVILNEFYDVPEKSLIGTHRDHLDKVATAIYQGERIEALTEAIRIAYTPTYVYSTGEEVPCDWIMDSKPYSTMHAKCPECGAGFICRPSGECSVIAEDK